MGIAGSFKRGFKFLSEVIDEGMEFGKKHIKSVIGYQLVSMIVALAAIVVVGIGAFISLMFIMQYSDIAAYAITAILVIAGILVGGTYSMAAGFGAIEFIYKGGKKVGYFESDNVSVAFKWIGFWLGLFVLLAALVAAIVLLVPFEASEVLILVAIAVYLVILLVICIIAFMLYYVEQELAIKKLGPIEAMKSAFRVFKKNFWETLVFALVIGILGAVIQVPLQLIAGLIGQAAVVVTAATAVLLPIGIVVLVLTIIVRLIVAIVVESAALILKVKFYQKITKPKTKRVS
ncbi:MAG: hypothetical protein GY852_09070 [bacterium]|nr:hypothetical protein [bacterium]